MTEGPTGVDFFAGRYLALLAERDALASELAGVRVELERTEGDWAVAIREATRARAALARVEALCERRAQYLTVEPDSLPVVWIKDVRAALSVAATDTEETP